MDDVTKTDIFGLFKPVVGGNRNGWGHYLSLDMDMIDRLLAVQADRIERLEKELDHQRKEIGHLIQVAQKLEPPEFDNPDDE